MSVNDVNSVIFNYTFYYTRVFCRVCKTAGEEINGFTRAHQLFGPTVISVFLGKEIYGFSAVSLKLFRKGFYAAHKAALKAAFEVERKQYVRQCGVLLYCFEYNGIFSVQTNRQHILP